MTLGHLITAPIRQDLLRRSHLRVRDMDAIDASPERERHPVCIRPGYRATICSADVEAVFGTCPE